MRAQEAGTARTYVWTPPDSRRVVAYYSVTPTQVLRSEVPADAGGYSVVPAYLIARLALDRDLHGQGYGTDLLLDAVEVIVNASTRAAGRLIVFDAIDTNAAAFYQRQGFHAVKGDPLRLVMKMATARSVLTTAEITFSADTYLRMASLDLARPDGVTTATIVTADELRTLADRLQGLGDADVDFRVLLLEVLGRDIFAD
jgi:GNAT superfamily N-acetyltransferase